MAHLKTAMSWVAVSLRTGRLVSLRRSLTASIAL